jgi:rubrerythrin
MMEINEQTLTCDALDALNQALCREEDATAFYGELSERTLDGSSAKVFGELADESSAHAEILRKQIDELTKQDRWALPACVLACAIDAEYPPLPHDLASQRKKLAPDATELEAFLFAVERENENYRFYSERADPETDASAKQLYQYLVNESRRRYDLLYGNYMAVAGG